MIDCVQNGDGNGHSVRFLFFRLRTGPVLHLDGARPLLVGDEAVRESLVILWYRAVRAEVQSEKKRLDPDAVKTVSFFCHFVDILYEPVQQGEAVLHILDAGGILRRHI